MQLTPPISYAIINRNKRLKQPIRNLTMSTPENNKKPNYKKLLTLLLTFVVATVIYQLAIYYCLEWMVHVYYIGAGVLAVLYIVINRGMLKKPEKSDLPDSMTDAEKDAFISEAADRRKRSEFILYLLFALILSIVIDLMYIFLTVNMGVELL